MRPTIAHFSVKPLVVTLLLGISLFFAGQIKAVDLKVDLNCDGRVDLDDYTLMVRARSVDFGQIKNEWGKIGSSTDAGCLATATPFSTPVATVIISSSPTPTPTTQATIQPTSNPTAQPTATPANPTPTPTVQPTAIPTPSPTPTPGTGGTNPTPTPTATPTPTPSPSPTPSPTPVSTPTPTPTPTPLPTPTPTPIPTPSPTPSVPALLNINDATLLAYFQMEESSGTLINKAKIGNLANLFPNGTPVYSQPGKSGKAIKVSALGNFCSGSLSRCADAPPYKFTSSFSLGMWVKLNSGSTIQTLFRKWEAGQGSYAFSLFPLNNSFMFIGSVSHPWSDWLAGYDVGQFHAVPKGRSYRQSQAPIPLNTWTHVVVVRDAAHSTYDVYLNGQKMASNPGVTTQGSGGVVTSEMRNDNQPQSVDPFRLGEIDGYIDEFFAYGRALTPAEIQTMYQAGANL